MFKNAGDLCVYFTIGICVGVGEVKLKHKQKIKNRIYARDKFPHEFTSC